MWKLFITVVAMSDTGAISTNVIVVEYHNNRNDCVTVSKGIVGATDKVAHGHNFKIVTSAQCNGSDGPPRPPGW